MMEVLIFVSLCSLVLGQNNYCQLSPQHTMCKYSGTGPSCVAISGRGVSNNDAKTITDLHNRWEMQMDIQFHDTF